MRLVFLVKEVSYYTVSVTLSDSTSESETNTRTFSGRDCDGTVAPKDQVTTEEIYQNLPLR